MIREVTISVSDPWDLGEALGWRVLTGELVRLEDDDHGGRALIRLDAPIEHAGVSCSHVIASPRHAGDALASLASGQSVLCGFIGVADASAATAISLDTSGWRGGLAFIGTIEPSAAPPGSRHRPADQQDRSAGGSATTAISPIETEIRGAWITSGGQVAPDAACRRIEQLVSRYLVKLGRDASGWDTLFRDPADGRYWELVYPRSEMHGGGPPTLRRVDEDALRTKYRVSPSHRDERDPEVAMPAPRDGLSELYAAVFELVRVLRSAGHERPAAILDHRMRRVAWTSASELVEELQRVLLEHVESGLALEADAAECVRSVRGMIEGVLSHS